ncbi:MAG: ATP-binding protein [Patescibacteria group bacterium]
MKIAVVGAHGTGKTTLSRGLVEHFGFNYIPDIVADAFRLNFPINEETPPETQLWILSKQLEMERNTPLPWVMEKTLWDNIVYGSYSIKNRKVLEVIEDIVERNAKYDLLLYCPIEFSISDDGLRSLNMDFQRDIDKGLRKILRAKRVKFYEVWGDIPTRLSMSVSIINKLLRNKS